MKYIILLNNFECLDDLNILYKSIKFIPINELGNKNKSYILFFIRFSDYFLFETENNIFNIISKKQILSLINTMSIFNILYDEIYSLTDIYNDIQKLGIDNTILNCNIGNPDIDIINFFKKCIEDGIKNKYEKILIFNKPIFNDNFKKKFLEEKDVLCDMSIFTFNSYNYCISEIPAISINCIHFNKILTELNNNNFNIKDIIGYNNTFTDDMIINEKINNLNENNFNSFKSIHQKYNLLDLIKIYKIDQCHISKPLTVYKYIYSKIQNYNDKFKPLLIIGVFKEEDIEIIYGHKSDIYIYWYENECNPNYKNKRRIMSNMLKLNNIKFHICDKKLTCNYLSFYKIKPIILSSNNESNLVSESIDIKYFNNNFKNIFVISLKSDLSKRNLIKEKFKEVDINFLFFDAINGHDEPYINEYNIYNDKPFDWDKSHFLEKKLKRKVIRSPGAYGYLKTWEKLLCYAIDNKLENICVFDDDVLFDYKFHEKFNLFIKNINKWLVINLGSTQHSWNDVKISQKTPNYYTPKNTDGSFAVCLDKYVFKELLFQVRLFNCAFDTGPLRYLFKKYPTFSYSLYPAIAIADVTASSIGNPRNIYSFSDKVRWNLKNINFKKYLNCLLSVIIVVNNSQENLELCIKSLISQSYKSIEIILIDNLSNNLICKFFNQKYDNIKLFKNEYKITLNKCKKIGIDNSNGNFICFHDPNDISFNERFEIQINEMIEKRLVLCGTNFSRMKNKILSYTKDYELQRNIYISPLFNVRTLVFNKVILCDNKCLEESNSKQFYLENIINNYQNRKVYSFKDIDNNDSFYIKNLFFKIDKLLLLNNPKNIIFENEKEKNI